MERKTATQVKISLATGADANAFLKLEALCFNMPFDRDTIYFWRPVVSYLWAFKAQVRNKIVGGIIAMPTRDGDWYVNSLFVHPRYRRKGIASELLGKIVKLARGKKILLDVKTGRSFLLDFYADFGFRVKEVMKDYYGDSTDRYLLERGK